MSKFTNAVAVGAASLLIAGVVAAPTAAQPYGDYQRGHDYEHRDYQDRGRATAGPNLTSSYVDSLEWRIGNAAQEGRLSRYEARRLLSELRQIQGPAIFRVENGRASGWEIRRVSNVVQRIEAATEGYAPHRHDDRYGYRDN